MLFQRLIRLQALHFVAKNRFEKRIGSRVTGQPPPSHPLPPQISAFLQSKQIDQIRSLEAKVLGH